MYGTDIYFSVLAKTENALIYPANEVGHAKRRRSPPCHQNKNRGKMMLCIMLSLHPRSLKKVCHCPHVRKKKRHANQILAPGMFNQIDELSLPGAGLRHLDFHSEIPSMFQSFFTGDGSQSHMQVPLISPPLNSSQPFVRTYGSEPEM